MAKAIRASTWPAWFETDYRWSLNTLLVLSFARHGGSEIGEVDHVVRRLLPHVGDDERWFEEWVAAGHRARELGEGAERQGKRLSAGTHFRRATAYYFMAERFRIPKDRVAHEVYLEAVHLFRRAAALRDDPIEFLAVPFEGASLPALIHSPERTGVARSPVVVFFTGFDGNKELNWYCGIPELVNRGLSVISVDTPGVGEAIRFHDIYLRYDYEVAGSAVLDYLETRDDIDARRAAVMGMSLGGYYASRTAVMEPRFSACVAWGAQWDYHEVWRKRVEAASEAHLPVPADHLMWSTNTSSPQEALRRIEKFTLDGIVQTMRCPFLVCHGADDQQIPVEYARRLYEASGSLDKDLLVLTDATGGTQHCNLDNLSVATTFIFDWLADKLDSTEADSLLQGSPSRP